MHVKATTLFFSAVCHPLLILRAQLQSSPHGAQCLAQGHFGRLDALQCVGFEKVSAII